MSTIKPLYISPKGGSIICFAGISGRIFRSCSANHCVYSADLHSAKAHLDNLEYANTLHSNKGMKTPVQRKTTLKWNTDGELSAVDMARILDRLDESELTKCELACDLDDSDSHKQDKIISTPVPISAWLP